MTSESEVSRTQSLLDELVRTRASAGK
jgi:hypothetical protein